jgi:hypothetical protein
MDRFTARRKLLRGSLSAPVVLTVASPSALAQTSFLACITRGGVQTASAFDASKCGGNAYRKEVDLYVFQPNVLPTPPATDPYAGKLFARRENTANSYDSTDGAFLDISPPTGYTVQSAGSKSWKLVYFNDQGQEVGYGFVSNSGTPVSCSCWTSFNFKPV